MKRILMIICITLLAFFAKGFAEDIVPAKFYPVTEELTAGASTLYSKALKLDWNYSVYLPKVYNSEGNDKEYPVIYLLHGANGNHTNMKERFDGPGIITRLIDEGIIEETIAVFVDGFNSYYFDGACFNMETALIEDLIPTLEANYRIKQDREYRKIGGISMGGFGSARLALKYPELFSGCMLLSPAIWESPDNDNVIVEKWNVFQGDGKNFSKSLYDSVHPRAYFESYKASGYSVKFYIAAGDADTVVPIEETRKFALDLSEFADCEFKEAAGAGHNWIFWEAAFEDGLACVLKK